MAALNRTASRTFHQFSQNWIVFGRVFYGGLKLVSSHTNYSKLANESRKFDRINPDK